MRLAPLLFLGLILLLSCQYEETDSFLERKSRKEVVPIETLTITKKEIPLIVQEKGVTEASDRFEVVTPEGGEGIAQVFVEVGQSVEAGDRLIQFDDEELKLRLDLARSQIEESETGLEDSRYKEKNKERLLETLALSEEESEGLDEETAHLEAQLSRAKNEVNLLEEQLQNIQITSPISGLVTKRSATAGATAEKGNPLLEIVRITPIWFAFSIPLDVVTAFEKGDPVTVRFPDLNQREFSGEVLAIGAEASSEGRVQVKLSIPNDTGLLKAGINGEVNQPTSLKKTIVTLPEKALIRTERSTYVYKVIGDRVKKVAVKVEEGENGELPLTKGLSDGDQVAISGIEVLKNGQKIEIRTANRR
ncbi:MAG: efflux RND transporter periplasmic adaptor subunit [Deltaproteobacteria bacterium]|nr:efflux RND transporter periplasmic adaptor subunit [Deltaproteobacteria bacterium]MBI4373316.1 efflux RND transporter periplasmic adaptor subunit [Deltaproteobacteria bacterium]